MKWYDKLYIGEKCSRSAGRLQYKIANGIPHKSAYLVTLPLFDRGILEIVPSMEVLQPNYPRHRLIIVGIGESKGEALELLQFILEKTYEARGDFNVTAYLFEEEKKE